jgi:2-dehydropantoate 2-reductase
MGALFGGLLAEHGLRVTLMARRAEHVAAIRERGLRIVGEGGDRFVVVEATTDTSVIPPADLVLVQCKASATREVCAVVAPLMARNAVAVSFQNGLGNEDIIASVIGPDSVLGGLTSLGATLEAPGVVRNYAELPTLIGEVGGGITARATDLAKLMSKHGIRTVASNDIVSEKWRKLMLNVAMSATSGLTGLTIGEVAALPALAAVARRAMDEAAMVAEACGVELCAQTRYAVFEGVVASGAARNKTSMRRDIEAGRPTEVGAIYLSVIERGRAVGIATPTLEALAGLVIGIEAAQAAG